MMLIGRKLQQDVVINIAFAGLNILGVFLLTRLSTRALDEVTFGIFMLTRRYSMGLSTFAELGGSLAQYRYMGMYAKDKKTSQMVSAIVLLFFTLVSTLLVGITFLAEKPLMTTFFPNAPEARWLLWITVAMAVEQLLHFNISNNLLQERRMLLYNLYNLLNIFGIFVIIFAFLQDSSAHLILTIYLVASGLLLLTGQLYYNLEPLLRSSQLFQADYRALIGEVLSFGLLRGWVSFLTAALLVVGPWLLRANLAEVGYISVIYLFFQTLNVIITPISKLSMIVSARQLSPDNETNVALGARLIFGATVIVATVFVVAIYPWHHLFLQLLVSRPDIIQGASQYGLLLFCIIPLSIFYGLRGIIEMRWTKPYNFINLLTAHTLGLLCFFGVRPFSSLRTSVIVCLLVTFWVLGGLTTWTVRRYLEPLRWTDSLSLALMAVLFLGINLLVRDWFVGRPGGTLLLQYGLSAISGVLMPLTWWLIWKPHFVQELLQRTGWAEIATQRLGRFFPKPWHR